MLYLLDCIDMLVHDIALAMAIAGTRPYCSGTGREFAQRASSIGQDALAEELLAICPFVADNQQSRFCIVFLMKM